MSSASVAVGKVHAAHRRVGSIRRERRLALVGAYVALAVFVVFFLTPPFHMLVTSLKSSAEIADLQGNPWIVKDPTLQNYYALLTQGNFVTQFRNSVVVTLSVVAITMVISVFAAFALSRMRFWGSTVLATGVFLTYLVPETLLFIPLFQIVGKAGLYNNLLAMILIYPTLTVPFCT